MSESSKFLLMKWRPILDYKNVELNRLRIAWELEKVEPRIKEFSAQGLRDRVGQLISNTIFEFDMSQGTLESS